MVMFGALFFFFFSFFWVSCLPWLLGDTKGSVPGGDSTMRGDADRDAGERSDESHWDDLRLEMCKRVGHENENT